MTDMLLNKEVDVYIAFLLSLYYDLHIYVVNSEETVYMEYIPDTAKYVSGAVYANTVIIKRQNSGKYSIDTEAKATNQQDMAMYRINQVCKPMSGGDVQDARTHRGSAWFWRGAERQEGGYVCRL
jgi:hypothetical protein